MRLNNGIKTSVCAHFVDVQALQAKGKCENL